MHSVMPTKKPAMVMHILMMDTYQIMTVRRRNMNICVDIDISILSKYVPGRRQVNAIYTIFGVNTRSNYYDCALS